MREDIIEQGYDSVGAFLADIADEYDLTLRKVTAEWNEFDGEAEPFLKHMEAKYLGSGREIT